MSATSVLPIWKSSPSAEDGSVGIFATGVQVGTRISLIRASLECIPRFAVDMFGTQEEFDLVLGTFSDHGAFGPGTAMGIGTDI